MLPFILNYNFFKLPGFEVDRRAATVAFSLRSIRLKSGWPCNITHDYYNVSRYSIMFVLIIT